MNKNNNSPNSYNFIMVLIFIVVPINAVANEIIDQKRALKELREIQKSDNIVEYYDSLRYDRKKEFADKIAQKFSSCFPLKDRWDFVETPLVALNCASRVEHEPLNDKVLNILEDMLVQSGEPDVKLKIAALLYRTHRESGRLYLLNRLDQQGNEDAALILALNQDMDALQGISKMLKKKTPKRVMILTLGRWGEAVSSILEKLFLADTARYPIDYVQAFTLGYHRLSEEGTARIKQIYDTEWKKDYGKIWINAAVYHLWGDKKALSFLTERFDKLAPDDYYKGRSVLIRVLHNFRYKDYPPKKPLYEGLIDYYIHDEKASAPQFVLWDISQNLLEIGDLDDAKLVLAMLKKEMVRQYSNRSQRGNFLYKLNQNERLTAKALIDSGHTEIEAELIKMTSKKYVNTLKGIAGLRQLPQEFMPERSKNLSKRLIW
jgi:hypothetical protein